MKNKRCDQFVMLCMCACMGLGASQLYAECGVELMASETCWECPGFSFCGCVYVGQACVSQSQICMVRPNVFPASSEDGTFFRAVLQPCYIQRPCQSQSGGTCDPDLNPCVNYGSETWVGAWPKLVPDGWCDDPR